MCFSATASFVAGTALTGVGVAAIRQTSAKSGLPFAMVPLLFGVQQLTEGVVWLSFGEDATALNSAATWFYALFAFSVWPVFVPFAMWLMEPDRQRRRLLLALQVAGLAVGGYLLFEHSRDPVVSEVVGRSVFYASSHFYGGWVLALYFAATLLTCLVSSSRTANRFGVLAMLAALVSYVVWSAWFVSVWCFGAALVSVVIYRSARTQETELNATPRPMPWRGGFVRARLRS